MNSSGEHQLMTPSVASLGRTDAVLSSSARDKRKCISSEVRGNEPGNKLFLLGAVLPFAVQILWCLNFALITILQKEQDGFIVTSIVIGIVIFITKWLTSRLLKWHWGLERSKSTLQSSKQLISIAVIALAYGAQAWALYLQITGQSSALETNGFNVYVWVCVISLSILGASSDDTLALLTPAVGQMQIASWMTVWAGVGQAICVILFLAISEMIKYAFVVEIVGIVSLGLACFLAKSLRHQKLDVLSDNGSKSKAQEGFFGCLRFEVFAIVLISAVLPCSYNFFAVLIALMLPSTAQPSADSVNSAPDYWFQQVAEAKSSVFAFLGSYAATSVVLFLFTRYQSRDRKDGDAVTKRYLNQDLHLIKRRMAPIVLFVLIPGAFVQYADEWPSWFELPIFTLFGMGCAILDTCVRAFFAISPHVDSTKDAKDASTTDLEPI